MFAYIPKKWKLVQKCRMETCCKNKDYQIPYFNMIQYYAKEQRYKKK